MRVSGGTLNGTGTVAGGLTLMGGTVSPGTAGATNGTQFGTLTVGGLTVSGGSYAVDFGGAATGFASDLIRVNGVAALSGTVTVAPVSSAGVSFAGNDRFQQVYTIVQANSVTGTFANGQTFAAVSNDASLFYRLRYDLVPNAVVLQVQRQIDFRAAVPGGTANQLAVAGALNGAAGLASDSFAATLNALAASGGSRGATFDSLSGEAITSVTTGALHASDLFLDLLRARWASATARRAMPTTHGARACRAPGAPAALPGSCRTGSTPAAGRRVPTTAPVSGCRAMGLGGGCAGKRARHGPTASSTGWRAASTAGSATSRSGSRAGSRRSTRRCGRAARRSAARCTRAARMSAMRAPTSMARSRATITRAT